MIYHVEKPKCYYDCVDCPAYCCSVYERVQVTPRDIRRLAKHFGVTEEVANARYTKMYEKERVLRRKHDQLFGEACQFINPETRGCGIYHARPAVCREFPITTRCAYYDLFKFEASSRTILTPYRVQITFRNGKKTQNTWQKE